MRKVFRNGDWSITEIEDMRISNPMKHDGSFVFAEGEATGHFHTIVCDRPEDLTIEKTASGDYIFVIKNQARITHPEHSMKVDIMVPPGTYRLNQRREKDWMQNVTRKVID